MKPEQLSMNEISIFIGAVFAALVAVMGAFFKYMSDREKASREERQADRNLYREERKEDLAVYSSSLKMLGKTLEGVRKSNEKIALETKTGNEQAEQRNGHLGEQNLQITGMIASMTEQITKAADRNYKATLNSKNFQEVEQQHVHIQKIDGVESANDHGTTS